ncbi:MAG: hypothetical protein FJ317_07290, partial [SAR202 cluster bacterium]|nr:hypothetical protein [SAR202 cluster bacterium]
MPTRTAIPSATPEPEMVTVTFQFYSDEPEVDLRLPVFWGPQRTIERIQMEDKGDFLQTTLQLPKLSLIRYQFSVPGYDHAHREQFKQDWEVNRFVFADADKTVVDEVYSYELAEVARPATVHGRVTGENGEPVLEAVVVADGILTLTVDGYYSVAVRDREFPLTVFLLDGSYRTQSKTVRPGEVDFVLTRARPVTVTLNIDADPPEHHEVRLYASPSQLGGRLLVGNLASKDNFVTVSESIELHLYEGQWVDYLYSVGNPVISYEYDEHGGWVIRSFLAEDGLVINDRVGSFTSNDAVTLEVVVPDYTGDDDIIGVEHIHPTPLFMHRAGEGRWVLTMNSNDLSGRSYRYYKTFPGVGFEARDDRVITANEMHDTVTAWFNQDGPIPAYTFDVPQIENPFKIFGYPADFYSSFHDKFMGERIEAFKNLGYQGMVLTEAWGGYVELEPTPRIVPHQPLPVYMPVDKLISWTRKAHEMGLEVMIQPQLGGAEHLLAIGQEFDEAWWRAWLVEIERVNMHM